MSLMVCGHCQGSFTLDDIPTDGSAIVCPHCGQSPFSVVVGTAAILSGSIGSGQIGGYLSASDPTATVPQPPPSKPTPNPFYKHARKW